MIGRLLTLVYALVCYAAGMATLAYTAGWLGGFLVPNQLDAPASENLVMAIVIDVLLLLAFAVQHSVMARPSFKEKWTRFIPPQTERSTYVLASSIVMFAMMWYWQPIGIDIWRAEGATATLLYAVYALGWAILVIATFFLNHFDLFGLRQAWLHWKGQPYQHIPFRTPGFYRWVRHPIYVGWLVLFWGTPTMTVSHLLFALASTIYIVYAVKLEEKDLRDLLPEYEAYARQVPALIPGTKP